MSPMKVAVVTAFPADPEAPRGGVEAVSVNLVRGLARAGGLAIDVVTADRGRREVHRSTFEGATVHRLPQSERSVLRDAVGPGRRRVGEYLRELRPDVIHAHDVYGLMVKGLPFPRVFTIHGFIHADTLVSGTRFARLRSLAWRFHERRGWADQGHIVSISPYVRERLADLAGPTIHDIDNPVSEDFFAIERRERPGTVFCAAAICKRKNQLGLVEAFARAVERGADATLRLAGHVQEPDYGRRLEELVRARGLERRVSLLGPVGSAGIRRELAEASVFALVSLEENSPMGIEEAMAARVPVLTSNRCGMPYMVREGETGYLVEPGDPAEIGARLARLLGDADLRRSMGEKARAVALDRFHPETVARRTIEVYRRAAAGAGAAAG